MWVAIIIVFVVAMALGPVMMMQPSPAQRRLAKLRSAAQAQGIQVGSSLMHDTQDRLCWYYWKRLPKEADIPPGRLVRKAYEHGAFLAGVWDVEQGGDALKAFFAMPERSDLLQQIPESVAGIEVGPHAVGVHWNERGGLDVLPAVIRTIEALALEAP